VTGPCKPHFSVHFLKTVASFVNTSTPIKKPEQCLSIPM